MKSGMDTWTEIRKELGAGITEAGKLPRDAEEAGSRMQYGFTSGEDGRDLRGLRHGRLRDLRTRTAAGCWEVGRRTDPEFGWR